MSGGRDDRDDRDGGVAHVATAMSSTKMPAATSLSALRVRRRGRLVAVAAIAGAAAVIGALALIVSTAPAAPGRDAGAAATALDAWRDELARANPWVSTSAGVAMLSHQVTHADYAMFARYLAATGATSRAQAVAAVANDGAPSEPVVGVASAQAAKFCAALGARLPETAQWAAARGQRWWLSLDGGDGAGPAIAREWTQQGNDPAHVALCGGYRGMTVEIEATLTGIDWCTFAAIDDDAPELLSHAAFRCARDRD